MLATRAWTFKLGGPVRKRMASPLRGARFSGMADGGVFRIVHTPYVPVTDEEGNSKSRIQPYPPMTNPCRLCPARCCHTSVKASLPDVLHYCRTLEVPVFAGFVLEQSLDERRGFEVERDPRVVDPADGWPGRAEIRLRRRADGGCAGLVDVGGHARCGVYAARPMNCRLYPVSWEDDQGRGGPEAVLCPAPFAVTPAVAAQVEADAALARARWAAHEAAVAAWAAADVPDRSLERALGFLLEAAARELGETVPKVALAWGTPEDRLSGALLERGMMPPGPAAERAKNTRVFAGLPED
jgi:Fe-S-cluster containining protein